jgi:hypothetical protein
MQYYHSDVFQRLALQLGLNWCKFVQNGKTLGQFFDLLYRDPKTHLGMDQAWCDDLETLAYVLKIPHVLPSHKV